MADQNKKADEFSLEEDDLFEDFELVSACRVPSWLCTEGSLVLHCLYQLNAQPSSQIYFLSMKRWIALLFAQGICPI